MKLHRKTNVFERLLLIVGLGIAIFGFYLLNMAFDNSGRVFDLTMLSAVFLWMLLIFVMILAAISENQREELAIIISEHIKETKILRTISNEHLEEIRLLREELKISQEVRDEYVNKVKKSKSTKRK